jgi:hypothetical protein
METVGGSSRPTTYQEFAGHGLMGCINSPCRDTNNDMIRYVPSHVSERAPTTIPDGTQVDVQYRLLDGMTLYSRRYDRPTFSNIDEMAGDGSGTCGDAWLVWCDGAALAVWAHGDARMPCITNRLAGEHPAAFMSGLFVTGNHAISDQYVSHPFVHSRPFLHEKCATGRPMQGSADACVSTVCATDSYCCTNWWDDKCVE